MRVRVFRHSNTRQVKCNLCHQWIITHNQNRNTLNSCCQCLEKYSEGGVIYSEKGQKYRLLFVKEQQYGSQSFLKSWEGLEEQTEPSRILSFNRSKIEQMMLNCQLSSEEKRLIGSRIQFFSRQYEQEAENICQLIKQLTHAKSQTFLQAQSHEKNEAKYKSEIFYQEPHTKANQLSMGNCRLEDFCLNLDQTRYIKAGYEYYFDSQQRSRFAGQFNQKIESRAFGTQLKSSFLNHQNLFLNLYRKTPLKTNRSFTNLQNNSVRQLRMSEQVLKQKISLYLQNKYPSGSLHKIIHMNTKQAYERTNIYTKMIQLISFKISSIDLSCYLNLFQPQNIQTIKLVNVGLNNAQLGLLLDYIWNRRVQRLVLSGNKLTDGCLPLLLSKSLPFLKQIYLGKNRINKYRMKQNIVELRSKFVIYI